MFGRIFSAESIGSLSFAVRRAVRARFSGEKLNFSVLNVKKLKKFSRFKPIEVPIKKYTFHKAFGHHTLFLTLNNIKLVSKKVGFTRVPLIFKTKIFGPQI